MLNLYWKIFFGFWLTGLALGGGALFVNLQLRQDISHELQGLTPTEIINRTSFIIRRLPDDIEDWKDQLSEQDIRLYLTPQKYPSLSQQQLPEQISKVFAQLDDTDRVEIQSLTRLVVGINETVREGEQVQYVMSMPGVNVFRFRQFAEQLTVQLMLAISLSAVACLILARYLTRNLGVLSTATKSLASGDLSTRAEIKDSHFQDELTLLARDFNHMAESLEASVEAQRRLVRDISHELRSPLARLQIALELARENGQPEQLDRIELEAERLNEMISQILAMPDAQHAKYETCDLLKLCDEIIDNNKIEAQQKGVTLRLIPKLENSCLEANRTQITSAIENIVRNAIHYTDTQSDVKITLEQQTETVQITVSDRGPGVPTAELAHIFEPFYRVDLVRNRKTGGYGVGLAIVKRAIESHGGTVKAQNLNPGLSVTLSLPRNTS